MSTEAGFGTCQHSVQSVCQPPVLSRSCSLPRQPQHHANPELASGAKCSYFTVALLQGTGNVYHPLTSKTHSVPAKGHPTIPRNKRKEKGWMPCLGLLVPNPFTSKAAAISKSGVKRSPQVPGVEGTQGAPYTCTFPSREGAACRELGLPYPCSGADIEELCGQHMICGRRRGKPRKQRAVSNVVQAKKLNKHPGQKHHL